LSDPIAENGVIGAGGGGFPAAVKLSAKAKTFLVNAAECEPLLHKDKELLVHFRGDFFRGMAEAMDRTGAAEGVIGIKEKYEDLIESIGRELPPKVRIHPLKDTYPAGDEFMLVFEVAGRAIPPGGLPKDVGCAVSNVETLVNIGAGRPVTTKFLTVAGSVRKPVTLRVPVGISFRECIQAAGGAMVPKYEVLSGGVMMGALVKSLDEPVTKTTGGLIVLPAEHPVLRRYHYSDAQARKIGRSACDQCSFCTELCPRYLLGHPIQPHLAMRALGFETAAEPVLEGTLFCCECNLCSMYSCPEDLDPRRICSLDKAVARKRGIKWSGNPADSRTHELMEWRRVPTARLMRKLGLNEFVNEGPLKEGIVAAKKVKILLRQGAGAPAESCVEAGQVVSEGQLVAAAPPGKIGANIHASIAGRVSIAEGAIVVEA
jgi:Na+-translocating ferredoxin:NAD+ oxidoreductase RnfC subunit